MNRIDGLLQARSKRAQTPEPEQAKRSFMEDVRALLSITAFFVGLTALLWAGWFISERRFNQGRVFGNCEVMASHKTRRTLNRNTYICRENAVNAAEELEEITGQSCWVVKKRPHINNQPKSGAYVVIHQDILNGLCLDDDRYLIVYCTDNPGYTEEVEP